jgi:leucyl aminopeptidase (aminopeptidase T)
MARLIKAARTILNECMDVKAGERVLIITDKNRIEFVHTLLKEAQKITTAKMINIPVGARNGEEPPRYVAREMKKYNVVLMLTAFSLTHTKATRDAAKAGARIASMPGITKGMMKRAIVVDYENMDARTKKIKQILDKGKDVRVTTRKGTDLRFSIKEREAEALGGLLNKKGIFGNLPSGEVFIAPREGTADGVYIVDGSILNRNVRKLVKITVKKGYAVKIEGAEDLKEVLEKVKDLKAYNIAEFGIGTNPKAKVTGRVLEDEKAKGTCHIALGNNIGFGGKTDVPIHVDGIILKPTIFVDGKKIIKDGKLTA